MTVLKDKERYELVSQHTFRAYTMPDIMDVLYDYWCTFRFWRSIRNVVPFRKLKTVLDVGCGVTSVLNVIRRDFPHLELTGVDPLMDEYQKLYEFDRSITWKRAYLEDLALPAHGFDVVCCTNALDHVENLYASLNEIKKVLAPEGIFLLTLDVFAQEKVRNEGHPYTFTKVALLAVIKECGFRIEWMRLSRRKLGVGNYADYRLGRKLSRAVILWSSAVREQVRSYGKQIFNRGAIGEMVLIARVE